MRDYSYDPHTATAADTLSTVYIVQRERAASEYGLPLEPVPDPPRWCDTQDDDRHRTAVKAWRNRLCQIRVVRDLDAHLHRPFEVTHGAA